VTQRRSQRRAGDHPPAPHRPASRGGDLRVTLALGAVAFLVYLGTAWMLGRTASPSQAYFDHLAGAFLHGRLDLVDPPHTLDLTSYAGRWYVPFPPLPALLLLPWVALAGVAGANTVLFAVLMGALNVMLAHRLACALARQGVAELSPSGQVWLAVMFGFGSVHWYVSTLGTVWFTSQVCTVTFLLLGALLALTVDSPLAAGAALGAAMLGRPHVGLALPLLAGLAMHRRPGEPATPGRIARWTAWAALPALAAAALLLAYNAARFGSPWDFGYLTESVSPSLRRELDAWGQFSPHYLPRNLWAMLLATPQWIAPLHAMVPDPKGMSVLLTTPALAWLARVRARSAAATGAWLALALVAIPILTYYNTGWAQFGYRFSLDLVPAALVLLAIAFAPRPSRLLRACVLAGVLMNAWGAWWFRNPAAWPFVHR
jgi:hypothetical protein